MKPYAGLLVTIALALSAGGGHIAGGAPLGGAAIAGLQAPPSQSASKTEGTVQEVVGSLSSVKGSRLTITTQTGRVVEVDATAAIQGQRSATLVAGSAVDVRGTYDRKGVLHADTIARAKDSSVTSPAGR